MELRDFSKANKDRCEADNGYGQKLNEWTTSEWFVAIVGELGEAANVVKKFNRAQGGGVNDETYPELHLKLSRELADTFIYLDLIVQSLGLDLSTIVVETFNAKSKKIGYIHPNDEGFTFEKKDVEHDTVSVDQPCPKGAVGPFAVGCGATSHRLLAPGELFDSNDLVYCIELKVWVPVVNIGDLVPDDGRYYARCLNVLTISGY